LLLFSFSLEVEGCGHPLFLFLFFIFTKKNSLFFIVIFLQFSLFQAGCDHHLGYGDGWMRSKGESEN